MAVTIVPVSDLRREAARLLKRTSENADPIYITQHGRPKAVLLGYEAYEHLMTQLEDLADLDIIRERADEPSRPFIEFLQEISEA